MSKVDHFETSVGMFWVENGSRGFELSVNVDGKGRELQAGIKTRQDAHQLIGDQATGLPAWDDMARENALAELRQDDRWYRYEHTSVVNPKPGEHPSSSDRLPVPAADRPRL